MPRRLVKNRNIEVILLQDDKYLGEKYEIVSVKPIFARNVLLPQNIAVLADKANKNKYEQKMQAAVAARAKKAAGLEDLFAKMAENGWVKLVRKVNKDNVLYAKVNESDIVEGTKTYNVVKGSTYNFIFKAIDNGTYVIIFPQHFQLLEATGEIHEDVDIYSDFYSLVYAQEFVKGDYIKLEYPKLTVIEKIQQWKLELKK